MSQAEKTELVRREFAREAREADFEERFVKEIIMVCKRMGGWSLEYVLKMPALRYIAIKELLLEEDENERKSLENLRAGNAAR